MMVTDWCFCFAGTFRGVCKKIDHFPEDADYEADAAEYLLRKSLILSRFYWLLMPILQPSKKIVIFPTTYDFTDKNHSIAQFIHLNISISAN